MIKAYFDYDPVGSSVFALANTNGDLDTTYLSIDNPQALVEAIAGFVTTNKVNQLYCNKTGLTLGTSIKQYLIKQYNYTTCEVLENKE